MSTTGYRGGSIYGAMETYGGENRNQPQNPTSPQGDPIDPNPPQIIPSYLEPIGDTGFWVTPSEPAEPWDCERFPSSPFCGGPGVDPSSIIEVSPFELDPSISFNECEVCLEVEGTFFFISVPPGHLCYRSKKQSCQPPPPPPPPPPPIPPPPPGGETPVPIPYAGPRITGCPHRVIVEVWSRKFGSPGEYVRSETPSSYYFMTTPQASWSSRRSTGTYNIGYDSKLTVGTGDDESGVSWEDRGSELPSKIVGVIPPPNPEACEPFTDPPPKGRKPPPPPPPPPFCPCMGCCKPSANDDNNDLLRLIALRLGAFSYPVNTPQWLVSNQGEKSISHQSITALLLWFVQQVDALTGEFPIKVEIEDSDPTLKGDQTKTVSLPNIAETLAEIYGLTAKSAIDSDLHTSFLMRLAVEMIATKTAALIAQDYASANASYLGYKGNEVERKVQFAFNPEGTESIEDILQSKNFNIKGWRNEDRDNVADYLQRIMFASGVLKSVFFRGKPDLERVIAGLKDFVPGSGGAQDQEWDSFLRYINNPGSALNSDSPIKPEIDDITPQSPPPPGGTP